MTTISQQITELIVQQNKLEEQLHKIIILQTELTNQVKKINEQVENLTAQTRPKVVSELVIKRPAWRI